MMAAMARPANSNNLLPKTIPAAASAGPTAKPAKNAQPARGRGDGSSPMFRGGGEGRMAVPHRAQNFARLAANVPQV